ncbi:MAG TPA: DEAD/DEAH box helicase, partial [Nocardioides sp.]|nr:DEAD/DEAH box helicase [Nocardioides sp.]
RAVVARVAGEERWCAVEDLGRLRDGLGVPVPPGTPEAFAEPVEDPLGDLVGRYARTHGPFHAEDVAHRLGLGVAVARHTLSRLVASGRLVEGEFRPAGSGAEWCDAQVLRRLRSRSLARLRKEVEPVDPEALGRFLPAWQRVTGALRSGGLRGPDGVLAVAEQLAGCPVPASALESLVLPARVVDYQPAHLDELTAAGEVLWAGHAALPGTDGWVSLHLADQAPLTLLEPSALPLSDLHRAVLDALAPGGAWFFRQLADALAADDATLTEALWDLVWAGRVSNDTLAPLRARTRSGRTTHRPRRPPPRTRLAASGRAGLPSRTGPPSAAGRWTLLPGLDTDPTRRGHATAERLLDRHGVVTRGAVGNERVPGGFAGVYRVLSAFEESGRCRRGYFVAGLGAAQFGTAGAVDRMRTYAEPGEQPVVLTLAATDPASPYGAALPWPERGPVEGAAPAHRPGRKAGALVVLVDGAPVLYVERGGRSLLTWTEDGCRLALAAGSLAAAARQGALGRITVERADGEELLGAGPTPLREALQEAGFVSTPRGLRLRS